MPVNMGRPLSQEKRSLDFLILSAVVVQPQNNYRNTDTSGKHGQIAPGPYAQKELFHAIALNAEFSGRSEQASAEEEQPDRQPMTAIKAVDCGRAAQIIDKHRDEQRHREDLGKADKRGVGCKLMEKAEPHQDRVVPEAVRYDLRKGKKQQKEPCNVSALCAGP